MPDAPVPARAVDQGSAADGHEHARPDLEQRGRPERIRQHARRVEHRHRPPRRNAQPHRAGDGGGGVGRVAGGGGVGGVAGVAGVGRGARVGGVGRRREGGDGGVGEFSERVAGGSHLVDRERAHVVGARMVRGGEHRERTRHVADRPVHAVARHCVERGRAPVEVGTFGDRRAQQCVGVSKRPQRTHDDGDGREHHDPHGDVGRHPEEQLPLLGRRDADAAQPGILHGGARGSDQRDTHHDDGRAHPGGAVRRRPAPADALECAEDRERGREAHPGEKPGGEDLRGRARHGRSHHREREQQRGADRPRRDEPPRGERRPGRWDQPGHRDGTAMVTLRTAATPLNRSRNGHRDESRAGPKADR